MGEFGYDYDTGDVVYHYGDGFAVGSDGKQYMEGPDGFMMDLDTSDIHYAPTDQFTAGFDENQYLEEPDGFMMDLDTSESHYAPTNQSGSFNIYSKTPTQKTTTPPSDATVLWRTVTIILILIALAMLIFTPLENWNPTGFWLCLLGAIITSVVAGICK